jgi:hypothetical protein
MTKKGYKMPESERIKRSLALKGRVPVEARKKLKEVLPDGYWKGKKMSEETKSKMSAACLGEKHWNYSYGCNSFWRTRARKVAEQMIGRKLNNQEVVHHKDFNIQNNSQENLFVFPSQREHGIFHVALQNRNRGLFASGIKVN